jgi:hypothetical protein
MITAVSRRDHGAGEAPESQGTGLLDDIEGMVIWTCSTLGSETDVKNHESGKIAIR